jgi:tight adherence protein B
VVGVCLVVAALWVAGRIRERRRASVPPLLIQERTADAVGAIAAAVRAGSSLPQAIRYAAREAAPPVLEDLVSVVTDIDTGVALDVSLASWADRRRSADIDLLVGALELHRRSGGELPVVLDQVSGAIRDRVSIAREVRSLTAQARLSAWILGLLPVGFFGFLWLTSRHDIEGALTTPVGLICVALGLALEAGAFVWIRSLLEVT